MELIKGKSLSDKIRSAVAAEIETYVAEGKRTPGLVFVRVGDGEDSASYLRSIERAATKAGFHFQKQEVAQDVSEAELLSIIETYNQDTSIDGIICSRPLPAHMDVQKLNISIAPDKDVEALNPVNAGKLLLGEYDLVPCTPEAVHQLLLDGDFDLAGKHCVILGRSNVVGKPLALLMLEENCTVTVCHSRTKNLAVTASQADILISAMGRAKMVDASYTNSEQIVIDVAINVDADGKLCGDVDFDAVASKVKAITPVPGGVGPVTNAILMQNTMTAYRLHEGVK